MSEARTKASLARQAAFALGRATARERSAAIELAAVCMK